MIDLDIKGFFDNIYHELLMKAVRHYTQEKHMLLYVAKWLNAPGQLADACLPDRQGTLKHSEGKGTLQGEVISPVLANILLDIVYDDWISKESPSTPFECYADDIVIHSGNIKEAFR